VELESQRDTSKDEIVAMSARLSLLADEVIFSFSEYSDVLADFSKTNEYSTFSHAARDFVICSYNPWCHT
jgi:precorrin-3B methylase